MLSSDDAMNQPLQHDAQAAITSVSVNATCKSPGVDDRSLVCVAEETPVAFRYNGFPHAVMMATPDDLRDFVVGFSRSEAIIDAVSDLDHLSIVRTDDGITLDAALNGKSLHRYLAGRRVRQMRGHTSCGLCGVEDFGDVSRQPVRLPAAPPFRTDAITSALAALRAFQPLSRLTRGAHASAWVLRDGSLRIVREDVGRHNSLDKLLGAMLLGDVAKDDGFCLITSRCSFEMVQKAVTSSISTLVSAGAPTALAIRLAQAAGLTLYSLSRDGEPLQFAAPGHSEEASWPLPAS
jgi:FdhD protein